MAPKNWQQVKNTFHDALRLESGERGPFLDKACNGDIDFRIEIESLLISLTEAKNFLEQPIIGETPKPDSEWRLKDGEIISHYRIVSPIASGGMGEVYLAEDEKLGRRVALKILPEDILADRNRLRRFRREAEVISALNHPNILTIFEFGDDHDVHFFASEFVKGETLRARLIKGRLSLHDALEIAMQIASALRAAHEAGVVHRDIKPENVMIRYDGYVKVLDFGLAKLTEQVSGDSVNATKEFLSQPGVIMGTVSYMSPEQARARSTDARSDLFSFGVVLFEMLTGHIPFDGETTPDVIAGIIQSDPRLASSYNSSVPDEMDRIIAKCLEKDRDIRYQTAADLLADLKRLSKDTEPTADTDGKFIEEHQAKKVSGSSFRRLFSHNTARSRSRGSGKSSAPGTAVTELLSNAQTTESKARWRIRSIVLSAFAVLLLAGAAAGLFWQYSSHEKSQNPLSSMRVKQLISWDSEAGEFDSQAKFSPNGTMIALSLTKNGRRDVWTKQIPNGKPNPITDGKWDYYNPIWSPDGQQIAFLSNRDNQTAIWETPFSGGVLTLIKATGDKPVKLLRWSKDGAAIYFQQGNNLLALDIASRQINQLTAFDSPIKAYSASISPTEDQIAYDFVSNERQQIFVMPLGGGPARQITDDDASNESPLWLPDGKRIIYGCKRSGVYQTCLANVIERTTEQINLGISDTLISDVAPDGTKLLFYQIREESDLWHVGLDDKSDERVTSDSGLELWPDVSPDGLNMVFQATTEAKHILDASILIHSIDDKQQINIASSGFAPAFSPDGRRVAFLRYSGNTTTLWTVGRNGGDEVKLPTEDVLFGRWGLLPYNRWQVKDFNWSPDSSELIYCARRDGLYNVWRVAADGASQPSQITNNADSDTMFYCPLFAPDGKRISYTSTAGVSTGSKTITALHVTNGVSTETVFSSESVFKLIGWMPNSSDILIATPLDKPVGMPIGIKFSLVSIGKKITDTALIESAYFYNIQLSPDGRRIALAVNDGKDKIRVISISDNKSVTINPDLTPNEYISNIVWSPDGKTIFFGKQKKQKTISMIENFK